MRITYYALKDLQVGEDTRQVGDLVPEAAGWPFLTGYVRDGIVAPVLVATLPESVQQMLLEWEKDQSVPTASGTTEATGDQPATSTTKTATKTKEKVA